MPKSTERTYNPNTRRIDTRTVGQDENLLAKGEAQDASGLGSKVKSDAFVPPRMEPNESSSAYSERVRKAREAHNQRRAMSR